MRILMFNGSPCGKDLQLRGVIGERRPRAADPGRADGLGAAPLSEDSPQSWVARSE